MNEPKLHLDYLSDGTPVMVPSMKDIYGWTFNLGINPVHIIEVIVWIGNTQYTWCIKNPLKVASKSNE